METTSSTIPDDPAQKGSGGVVNAFEQFPTTPTPTGEAVPSRTLMLQRQLEQLETVMDQFEQQHPQNQNVTVLRTLQQAIKEVVQDIHESQQIEAKSMRSLEEAFEQFLILRHEFPEA